MTSDTEENVAILLSILGEDVADTLLSHLAEDRAESLRAQAELYRADPVPFPKTERVLDEFERYLSLVDSNPASEQEAESVIDSEDEKESVALAANEEPEAGTEEAVFEASGDLVADLNQLAPYQLAGALASESTRTIAMVLNQLGSEKAAETLSRMTEEVRSSVFLQMNSIARSSPTILNRILQSTIDRALELDSPPDETNSDQKTADLLRSLDRQRRAELLEALQQDDEEAAERIRTLLYVFEDIKKVEGKSVQKLLGEVESSTLATALYQADEEIAEKLLGNMSKRAREALQEEIEFGGSKTKEEVGAARGIINNAMAALDEKGELRMEE